MRDATSRTALLRSPEGHRDESAIALTLKM
jgi:hypothetical protein